MDSTNNPLNTSEELRRISMGMMELVAKVNAIALHLELSPYLTPGGPGPNRLVQNGQSQRSKRKNNKPPKTPKKGPTNHHKKWSREDTLKLQELINSGASRKEMAEQLQRTGHAIFCRQRRLASEKMEQGAPLEEVIVYAGLTREELEKPLPTRSGRNFVWSHTRPTPQSEAASDPVEVTRQPQSEGPPPIAIESSAPTEPFAVVQCL
jgi:hypothetical protein